MLFVNYMYIREGATRKVFAKDPVFGGSWVPKLLPLEDSPITRVLQVAQTIKTKIGVNQLK